MHVPYNYLDRQFGPCETEEILSEMRQLVETGDFTIGKPVIEYERRLGELLQVNHVISTNSGTSALVLGLRALGIGPGDEVITQPNTFYATVGAIVVVGARPVFVDVDDQYQIDHTQIEQAITARTKALLPVHWMGVSPDMEAILDIAHRHELFVLEDACAAVGAAFRGKPAGSFGDIAAISMHPLKPLHVWGDGGAVVTNDGPRADWLRMYRNHGMINRDEIAMWGVNERLQTLQGVVANRVLPKVEGWIDQRIAVAQRIDAALCDIPEIRIPPRPAERRNAYQIYVVRAERRDALLQALTADGVEAKVHYPIPLHLQPAAKDLGYRTGDFPVAEAQAADIITLPCNQYLKDDEIDYMVACVRAFYGR